MYAFLWRRLPGPLPLRLALVLALLAVLAFVLWHLVFPMVDELLPAADVTSGG
jgi:hypothetical protein